MRSSTARFLVVAGVAGVIAGVVAGVVLCDRPGPVPILPLREIESGSTSPEAPETRGGDDPQAISTSPFSAPPDDAVAFRPPVEAGLMVHVVDATSREPVSGADVHYMSWDHGAQLPDEAQREAPDTLAFLERHGWRYQTDAAGVARVPRDTPAMLSARRGARWGFELVVEEAQDVLTVEIDAHPWLRVQVVDGADRPQEGILVAAWILDAQSRSARGQDYARAQGANAIASFRHAIPELRRERKPGQSLAVSLHLALDPPVLALLEGGDIPADPVRLVLPPVGHLRVRALGSDARPLPWFEGLARLSVVREELLSEDPATDAAPVGRVFLSGGVSSAVPVGLGVTLDVELRPGDRRLQCLGPVIAGEEIVVDFDLSTGAPSLRGRFVDAAGDSIADLEVGVWVLTRDAGGTWGRRLEARVIAGKEGRFEAVLRDGFSEDAQSIWIVFQTERGEPVLGAHLDTDTLGVPRGIWELGDVTLAPLPLIAAGQVQDENGTPRGGIDISLCAPPEVQLSGLMMSGYVVSEDGEGRFEVRGFTPLEELILWARPSAEKWNAVRMPFRHGACDLRVVIPRSGTVTGTWLGVSKDVGVLLLPPGGYDERIRPHCEGTPEGGRFEARGIPAGAYDLIVTVGARKEEVVCLEEIVVRAGVACDDARLRDIDLRGRVRLVRICVVDGAGQPVGATVNRYGYWGWTGDDGVCTLPVAAEPLTFAVMATGFRPVCVEGINHDHTVVLRPALRVRVEVDDVPDVPEGVDLGVLFRWLDGDSIPVGGAPCIDPRAGAPLSFEAPGVGRYRVVWRVRDRSQWEELAAASSQTVEIADVEGEQIFQLRPPPPEEVAAALARLRRQR